MMDTCEAEPQPFDDAASSILVPSNLSIVVGHQQLKVLFEEYTDNTFTTKKVCMTAAENPAQSWRHVELAIIHYLHKVIDKSAWVTVKQEMPHTERSHCLVGLLTQDGFVGTGSFTGNSGAHPPGKSG